MNDSLITLIVTVIFLAVLFIFGVLPQLNGNSNQRALPKVIHKIFAVLVCALFLMMGFFLGKHSSDTSNSNKSSTIENELGKDTEANGLKEESSLTLPEYLEEIRKYIDKEDYKIAAYLVADTVGVSPEYPPNDLHSLPKLPRGFKIGLGDQVYHSQLSKAYLLRAFAFRKLGEWSLAVANYNAAMKLAEQQDKVYYLQHRAATNMQSGNYQAALTDYRLITDEIERQPNPYVDIVDVYFGMGLSLEREGSIQEALDAYQNAQKLAYEYTPCECYSDETKEVDPLACYFIGLYEFKQAVDREAIKIEAFKQGCIAENPEPKKSKPKKYKESTKEKSEGPRRIGKPKKKIKLSYNQQRANEGFGKLVKLVDNRQDDKLVAQNLTTTQNQETITTWEKRIQACVADKIRQAEDIEKYEAKKRKFTAESALAYSYFRRGRLYLKKSMHKDSTVHDFIRLIKLCGPNENGACTELIELLGEKNYQDLRSLLSSQKADAAVAFLSDTLENVTVEEEEETDLSLKGWKLWGPIGLLVVIIGSIFFLVIWRKKEAKEN